MKLKSLITSLALQQIKGVDTLAKLDHVSVAHNIDCTCKIQWYMIFMLSLSILVILFSLL